MGRTKLPPGVTIERDGRPLNLTRVIDHTADGTPITAAERFLQIVALGEMLTVAAAAATLSTDTVLEHLKAGAFIAHQINNGDRTELALTPKEKEKLKFHRGFTEAYAKGVAYQAGLRNQIMRGGTQVVTRTTTTRTTSAGTETTEVVKVETLGPDPATIRWFAERRWPHEFGTRLTIDTDDRVTDPLDVDDTDRVAAMLQAAEAFLEQATPAPAVIDTTTHDDASSAAQHPHRNGDR